MERRLERPVGVKHQVPEAGRYRIECERFCLGRELEAGGRTPVETHGAPLCHDGLVDVAEEDEPHLWVAFNNLPKVVWRPQVDRVEPGGLHRNRRVVQREERGHVRPVGQRGIERLQRGRRKRPVDGPGHGRVEQHEAPSARGDHAVRPEGRILQRGTERRRGIVVLGEGVARRVERCQQLAGGVRGGRTVLRQVARDERKIRRGDLLLDGRHDAAQALAQRNAHHHPIGLRQQMKVGELNDVQGHDARRMRSRGHPVPRQQCQAALACVADGAG